jgi:hypothetical protein
LATAVAVGLCVGCHLLPQQNSTVNQPPQVHGQLVFHSDFPLPSSHRLVREVVAERDDICQLLDVPPTDEPIHVHLYRDGHEYAQFMAERFPKMPERRAFFMETDTKLIVHAHWNDHVAEDLRHEVAHGYLHSAVGNLPLWLDEGLAEYFEMPRGRHGLNRPHVELLAEQLQNGDWQPDLARLESLDDFASLTQLDYAESWAWVHFLLETEPARRELLQSYLAELRTNGSAKPLRYRLAKLHVDAAENVREYVLELRDD